MLVPYVIFGVVLSYVSGIRFGTVYGPIKRFHHTGDPGEPLILTPLINSGRIKEAQKASEVRSDVFLGVKSHSGYFTVDENFNSNLFFWYFPARTNFEKAPVVLWLQGGPGATSLIGLFSENGPFYVTSKSKVVLRKYAWTENHSVIYVDNPVGTGYSFTNPDGYCQNETIIGEHLYRGLIQFFQLFPELQSRDFYVTGESYGGKYVPAVSYTIHKNNPNSKVPINLKGLAIGNGLSDPENQLRYAEYLYQIGLIDSNVRILMEQVEKAGIEHIQKKEFLEAFVVFDSLINGDLNNHSSWYKNVTGFDNYFNYLIVKNGDTEFYGDFVQTTKVRSAIHVGNSTFHGEDQTVEVNLLEDVMQSVAPWVVELLDHYRVLIYNGQLDVIVAYPLTVNYLKKLQFSATEEYKTAKRQIWYVGEDLAGYVKRAGNLTEVLVRNAGHMVPADQPRWALDLITRFTHRQMD